jgi:predicted RNA-binding protein YlqC (UPF0109 family)
MGIESTVESTLNEENNVIINVTSEDTAMLIGRKGRTLQALQFILNRSILKDDDDSIDRITVDVEGYIQRRKDGLEDLAKNMAEKAKVTGRTMRLKPLDAHDRRIIHLTLENDEEVRTFSLGNSMLRQIVIVPQQDAIDGGDSEDEGDDEENHQDEEMDTVESEEIVDETDGAGENDASDEADVDDDSEVTDEVDEADPEVVDEPEAESETESDSEEEVDSEASEEVK